jgi:uncharacterized protein (DUF1697 family)
VTAFVAFLRAINLGPRRRVPMADLRAVLADAGYEGATTHLQSGNVLLQSSGTGAGLAEGLEATLAKAFGFDIDVMVRTATELNKVAKANPFLKRGIDPSTLAVGFLRTRPPAALTRRLDGVDFGREQFALKGSDLYLRYPNGIGRSTMSTAYFERALETRSTVRNWSVVTKLVELGRG